MPEQTKESILNAIALFVSFQNALFPMTLRKRIESSIHPYIHTNIYLHILKNTTTLASPEAKRLNIRNTKYEIRNQPVQWFLLRRKPREGSLYIKAEAKRMNIRNTKYEIRKPAAGHLSIHTHSQPLISTERAFEQGQTIDN